MDFTLPKIACLKGKSISYERIAKWLTVGVTFVLYLASFPWLHQTFGWISVSFSWCFIGLAIWFWGLKAGIAAAVFGYFLNVYLLKNIGGMLLGGPAGFILSVSVAAILGRSRDMSRLLRSQLAEREKIEKDLRRVRNQLEIRVARDISDRKKSEKETTKLKTCLHQAQKMEAIGTLAGGIAHDFNNILSAVIGYSEMALSKTSAADALQNDIQEVLSAGHRAKDLVKQILTFSRQAEQEIQPVQVKLIAREVIKLLRASLPATIAICQELDSDSAVLADPTQIHQVLMNLCTNAGYAMREKGGKLGIRLGDVRIDEDSADRHLNLAPGPYLKLTVSDTGQGIPAHIKERIFEPYFTTKSKGDGTGLGLAVVHGIVRDHGGTIAVDSQPGQGTAFDVYLPIIEKRCHPRAATETPLPLGHERILFIDDEQPLVDIGQRMLERCGYEVTVRTGSVEALKLLKTDVEKFDLIITDFTMPDMTGLELTKKVLHLRPQIPIILCTGFSEMITAETAKTMGIRAYLMKPLTIHELAGTVRDVLDKHSVKVN